MPTATPRRSGTRSTCRSARRAGRTTLATEAEGKPVPLTRQLVYATLEGEMPQRADKAETEWDQVRLPAGVVLKPPVSLEDLKSDTEYDPEGAEELVTLI